MENVKKGIIPWTAFSRLRMMIRVIMENLCRYKVRAMETIKFTTWLVFLPVFFVASMAIYFKAHVAFWGPIFDINPIYLK